MSENNAVIHPLVADIITANLTASQATTNHLIDSLTRQLADAEAHRAAVEHTMGRLLSGPYMPTPDAIFKALYPSDELTDKFRKGRAS